MSLKGEAHVKYIKRKYGANAYEKWGKKGGSPVLIAYREGRVRIIPKR
jgi:hypothetical protein